MVMLTRHKRAPHMELTRHKRAPHMEWEFMCKMGIVGEEVIGKEVGSPSGLSHSPPDPL